MDWCESPTVESCCRDFASGDVSVGVIVIHRAEPNEPMVNGRTKGEKADEDEEEEEIVTLLGHC
jgi:hypothetical protein